MTDLAAILLCAGIAFMGFALLNAVNIAVDALCDRWEHRKAMKWLEELESRDAR